VAQLVDRSAQSSRVNPEHQSYVGKEVEIRGFIIPAGPPDLLLLAESRLALGNYAARCQVVAGRKNVYVVAAKKEDHLDPCDVKIGRCSKLGCAADAAVRSQPLSRGVMRTVEGPGREYLQDERVASSRLEGRRTPALNLVESS